MPRYYAITFDTQTVETNGFNFDSGWLPKLSQFKNTETHILLSEVVYQEILRHLSLKTGSAKSAARSAHRDAVRYGLVPHDSKSFGLREEEPKTIAKERLDRFLTNIGAETVKPDDVSVREVLQAYFTAAAPFSESGKKKNEFPDAIALISLEKWAKRNGKRILAISGDGDWEAHAQKSDWLDHVKDIDQALKLFHEAEEALKTNISTLLSEIDENPSGSIRSTVYRMLENQVEQMDAHIEANSSFHVESDLPYFTLQDYTILKEDGKEYEFDLIESGNGVVVISIQAEISIEIEASFTFSVHDSIDGDDVPIGSMSSTMNEVFAANILITFGVDDDNNVEIEGCELVDYPRSFDFGDVSPNFDEEYERWSSLEDDPPELEDDPPRPEEYEPSEEQNDGF